MSINKYLRQSWQKPNPDLLKVWRERLIQWRREPSTLRVEHPTRLDRARALGYRAKLGFLVVRQRVGRGGHQRPWKGGRSSKQMRVKLALRKSYQLIAEERANKKFVNCEVLNSYFVARDGKNAWYEIILVDRTHPAVAADERIAWIANQRGRVFRGLTPVGRRMRGLGQKGKGAEKARPSRNAYSKRHER